MSQIKQILEYMQDGNTISPLEALKKFGSFRLGARIWELKQLGYPVKRRIMKVKSQKHVAVYYLEK
jgi:hypothetical protein